MSTFVFYGDKICAATIARVRAASLERARAVLLANCLHFTYDLVEEQPEPPDASWALSLEQR